MNFLEKYYNFVLYAIIGAVGTTLDSFILLFLNERGMYYLIASTIGFSIGVSINFVLNLFFNFKVQGNIIRRFVSYYSVGIIGLGVTSFILYLFVDVFNAVLLAAKLVAIIVVLFLQYYLNKKITFGKSFEKVSVRFD